MRFSEREGYKPVRQVLQVDDRQGLLLAVAQHRTSAQGHRQGRWTAQKLKSILQRFRAMIFENHDCASSE